MLLECAVTPGRSRATSADTDTHDNRSYHGHRYSYWAARLIQAFVVGRQIITEAEAEAWLREFDELDHQGAYFFA